MKWYDSENHPEDMPEEWYETYIGMIVGHVSLIRDALNPNDIDENEDITSSEVLLPRIFFSIGSWLNGEWVDGITGGRGVPLGLIEDDDVPSLLLGDYEFQQQSVVDPEDWITVARSDTHTIRLDEIGTILFIAQSLSRWEEVDRED